MRPYGVLLANAEHLEELFGLPDGGLKDMWKAQDKRFVLTVDDMEPEPEPE